MKSKYIHNIVYKITNTVNDKIYVGCHQTNNVNDGYMGSGKILLKAYQKYGTDKFIREILYDYTTCEEMFLMEKTIVDKEFVKRKDTYNIVIGGDGGWEHLRDHVIVKDKNGNLISIHKNDPRYLSGELISMNKNIVVVKDKDGNIFRVDKNDPRYLSGELVSASKGKIAVIDENNNVLWVDNTDPRFISGELKTFCKGKVTVKDKNGKFYHIDVNDPKYLSGELVGNTKGFKHSIKTLKQIIKTKKEKGIGIGEKNSQYNLRWIYNIETNEIKHIRKEELEDYLQKGWINGKKLKTLKPTNRFCEVCGVELKRNTNKLCGKCSSFKSRKVERPSYEKLLKDIEDLGYIETSKKYNVHRTSIYKWIKQYKKELNL